MTITDDSVVIDQLRAAVRDNYVFRERGTAIADGFETDIPANHDPAGFAEAATARLRELSSDLHLRVRHRPEGALHGYSEAAYRELYAREAITNSGGVKEVSRLDGGVGRLVIAPYLSPMPDAAPYLDAAFGLLRGADRLVIDLRGGRGGTPESVAYLCGFLLGAEPVHLQDIVQRDGSAQQFWTNPTQRRLPDDMPVAVLTSKVTFSGCEEIAYNLQSQGRARLFGETTGGGAHPVDMFAISDVLEVSVPIARSVNAVTGANWEGTGVIPDVACAAEDALETALAELAE